MHDEVIPVLVIVAVLAGCGVLALFWGWMVTCQFSSGNAQGDAD